jgi:hypothetical protein|tara:strand:+ start:2381 stop:2569 length:189 start_codon:yes stop_codon:yes gene_type:complete
MPTNKEIKRAKMIESIVFVLKVNTDMSFQSMIDTIFKNGVPDEDSEVSKAIIEWSKTTVVRS